MADSKGLAVDDIRTRALQRFEQLLQISVVPLIEVCADALSIRVSVAWKDGAVSIPALAQKLHFPAMTPAEPLPSISMDQETSECPLMSSRLTLKGVGECSLEFYARRDSNINVSGTKHSDTLVLPLLAPLDRAIGRLLDALASQVHAETQAVSSQAAFLHHYAHGICNICPEVRNLFDLLNVPRDPRDSKSNERVLTASTVSTRFVIDSLRNIDHLVNTEKHNALMMLSNLMPEYLTGVQRSAWHFQNPLDSFDEIFPGYIYQAQGRMISFEFDIENRKQYMPLVRIERYSFERLLHCLLSNALKYSYHGVGPRTDDTLSRSIKISCQPKYDQQGRFCMFSVQNYGIGIEPDEMGLVIEPGYRGRLARAEVKIGTGLGLADACSIAVQHGGRISISSKLLHHTTYLTTVRVILPIPKAHIRSP